MNQAAWAVLRLRLRAEMISAIQTNQSKFQRLQHQPTIDHKRLADDVGRKRRCQKQRGARHIGWRSQPLQRDALECT